MTSLHPGFTGLVVPIPCWMPLTRTNLPIAMSKVTHPMSFAWNRAEMGLIRDAPMTAIVASIEGVVIWTTDMEFPIYMTVVNLVDGPVTAASLVVEVVMPLRAALPARTNAAAHTCPT
jgi:hypothetical protein